MTAIEVTGSSSINKGIRREKFIDSIVFGKYVYVFIYDFI
jgi:hypothetical protein